MIAVAVELVAGSNVAVGGHKGSGGEKWRIPGIQGSSMQCQGSCNAGHLIARGRKKKMREKEKKRKKKKR